MLPTVHFGSPLFQGIGHRDMAGTHIRHHLFNLLQDEAHDDFLQGGKKSSREILITCWTEVLAITASTLSPNRSTMISTLALLSLSWCSISGLRCKAG